MTAVSVGRGVAVSVGRPLTAAGAGPAPFQIIDPTTGILSSAVTFTRASTGTWFNVAGALQVAAVDAARYDYDPISHAYLGLLIEEQRTNVLLRSTLAGGGAAPTGWVQPIATGTSAPAASIFGNADGAVAYLQTATAQRPFLGQTLSLALTTVHTASMLIETVSGLTATQCIAISGITPSTWRLNGVTIAAGTTVTPGLLEATFTSAGAGTTDARFGIGGSSSATGSLQFSRPQLAVGDFATSRTATTAASVTRSADLATITDLTAIRFNPAVGTLYVQARAPSSLATAATLFSFNDNTTNEVIRLHMNPGGSLRAQVIDGGVTVADLNLGTLTAATSFKAAMSYALNDIKGCLNGGTVQTDSSATLPTVDRGMIGRGAGGSAWNSNIRVANYTAAALNTQQVTL